nr:disease resistance protein RPP2B-like [Malus domestica]
MIDEEALKLLSWHAFGSHCPNKEYIELTRDVVDYCGGLPLALKVVGRFLATKKSKSIWESTLDRLRNIPYGIIHETLKISYDGLSDDRVKCVFLDISFFFIGWHRATAMAILDSCSNFSVESKINTLQDRCLLDIDRGFFRMHDLIRDMGREIVWAEYAMEPGKRSRLWHHEDVTSMLSNNSLPKKLKFLILNHSHNLTELPDFSKLPHIHRLILKGCKGSPELPTSLHTLRANYCIALEIMPDFSEMSKMTELQLKDYHKLKDIPHLDNSLGYMQNIHREGCTNLTLPFKESIQKVTYLSPSGNEIPYWLAAVTTEGEIVKYEVAQSIDDESQCVGSLCIDVANHTQRTQFSICPMDATVIASGEDYLWLGNLSYKKLKLKGSDTVLVHA